MIHSLHRTATIVLLIFVISFIGCDSADEQPSAVDSLVSAVREATQQYQSSSVAIAAGYVNDEHCVAHPTEGGMGIHWINGELIDPAFDPLVPEVMLYEPRADGSYRLIGVEYIVIDAGQERPTFAGHPMDIGGVPPLEAQGVPHWSLHVWAHIDNPAGQFRPFNPNVSCEHAHEHGDH